jgi:hypothetical protein
MQQPNPDATRAAVKKLLIELIPEALSNGWVPKTTTEPVKEKRVKQNAAA